MKLTSKARGCKRPEAMRVRRAALFDELLANEGQAWLTGTDQNLFEAFGSRAQMFEVRDGQVCATGD